MPLNSSVILTVIGPDRPGLVSALSEKAAALGANWLESRLAHLSGHFAGIVRLEVPGSNVDRLVEELAKLETIGLSVRVTRSDAASPAGSGTAMTLELVGQDKPGIVRDISAVLARHGVSIEELETGCTSGAMSGETMFRAAARLRLPPGLAAEALRGALEALGNELMVDIQLAAP